ncbi:hypothetical protein HDV01_006136 [Terramyces sp. JEL0728]|nr:hypothetical protein HDV01_006136 [Terramyces sp. JEL0728]
MDSGFYKHGECGALNSQGCVYCFNTGLEALTSTESAFHTSIANSFPLTGTSASVELLTTQRTIAMEISTTSVEISKTRSIELSTTQSVASVNINPTRGIEMPSAQTITLPPTTQIATLLPTTQTITLPPTTQIATTTQTDTSVEISASSSTTTSSPIALSVSNSSTSLLLIFGVVIPLIAILVLGAMIWKKCCQRSRAITPERQDTTTITTIGTASTNSKSNLIKLHEETSNNTIPNFESEISRHSITSISSFNMAGRPYSSPFANLRELENVGGFQRFKRDVLGFDDTEAIHSQEDFHKVSTSKLQATRIKDLPRMQTLKDKSFIQKSSSAEPMKLVDSGADLPRMVPLRESLAFQSKKMVSSARMENDLVIDNLDDDPSLPPVFQITKKIENKRLAPIDVKK